MISKQTLRNVQMISRIGNLFGVVPIKFDVWNSGINGGCDLIHSSQQWINFAIAQVIMRLVIITQVVYRTVTKMTIMPVDVLLAVLVISILLISVILIIFFIFQAEKCVIFTNDFYQMVRRLCKFHFM